ncbi:MAG: hypothetical protein WBL45_07460 [Solirubrobacterales bacterium]
MAAASLATVEIGKECDAARVEELQVLQVEDEHRVLAGERLFDRRGGAGDIGSVELAGEMECPEPAPR